MERSDEWCNGGGRQMMNKVDGMKQEVYSKDWVMHTGMSDL